MLRKNEGSYRPTVYVYYWITAHVHANYFNLGRIFMNSIDDEDEFGYRYPIEPEEEELRQKRGNKE